MARVIGDFDGDFTGFQRGGDQTLENPTSDLGNQYYGDVTGTLFDFSRGGNDTIFATGRGAALPSAMPPRCAASAEVGTTPSGTPACWGELPAMLWECSILREVGMTSSGPWAKS